MSFEQPSQLKTEKEPNILEAFRAEMLLLKETELGKKEKKEKYDPHFEDIVPDRLTKEDALIYEKVRDGTLTRKEHDIYVGKIREFLQNTKAGKESEDSRLNFQAWLGNEIEEIGLAAKWRAGETEKRDPWAA